jgi:hypothetical protein
MATGRTPDKYIKVQIEDATGAMRDIPFTDPGVAGISYAEQNVSALNEALESFLAGQGSFSPTLSGPFDNRAAVTASATTEAPKLSGSHTVLSALNGAMTPRSFAIYYGVQGYWTAGDPVFGGVDCVVVTSYTLNKGIYTCKIALAGNRVNDPAWGTAAITAS